ncbi:hypothetical protein GGR51DRAFT_537803 [Nemania sp. FL0031]|nr:hypothetical protein GGR51DRAFT_537803 [Nemania sp. FL0031]
MSNLTSPTTPPASPTIRRPDTGCIVRLGATLVPLSVTHTERCKCMGVRTDDEIDQLATTVSHALREGILECEKPTVAFAMILLGGEVVYDNPAGKVSDEKK